MRGQGDLNLKIYLDIYLESEGRGALTYLASTSVLPCTAGPHDKEEATRCGFKAF